MSVSIPQGIRALTLLHDCRHPIRLAYHISINYGTANTGIMARYWRPFNRGTSSQRKSAVLATLFKEGHNDDTAEE